MNSMEIWAKIQAKHLDLLKGFAEASDNKIEEAQQFLEELSDAGSSISDSEKRSQIRDYMRYWASAIDEKTGVFSYVSLKPYASKNDIQNASNPRYPTNLTNQQAKTTQRPNNSLEELRRALEAAAPIMVDESGHLMSEEAMALQQQSLDFDADKVDSLDDTDNPSKVTSMIKLKPARWF